MKVLVTGGTGFLGRHVVRRLLQAGDTVRVLVRAGGEGSGAAEHVTGDLRDVASLERGVDGVEAVVHCAARVSTKGSWEEFEQVTVHGTRRLLECAGAAGVRRFVHVSSTGVYALDGQPTVTEASALDDSSHERGHYTRSKIEAERVVWDYLRHRRLAVTVIRPGILYGSDRPPFTARLCFRVGGRLAIVIAPPGQCLPLVHVENVAEAIHAALRSDLAVDGAYNVVDDGIRQGEYLALLRQFGLVRARILVLRPRLISPLIALLDAAFRRLGRVPPVSRHQFDRAMASVAYDTSRARHDLDWRPKVTITEGLARMQSVQV